MWVSMRLSVRRCYSKPMDRYLCSATFCCFFSSPWAFAISLWQLFRSVFSWGVAIRIEFEILNIMSVYVSWTCLKHFSSQICSKAVFIDNVTDGSTKKRQRDLGLNAPRNGWVIASELRSLVCCTDTKL